jgi:hypothetical protein
VACPQVGPCSWDITSLDLCCLGPTGQTQSSCLENGTPIDDAIIDASIQASTELVWALTGRQFGVCSVKIRPCRKDCSPCPDLPMFDYWGSWGGGYGGPQLIDGQWYNVTCPTCSDCSCVEVCEIKLPYPVCCIEEVKVDGIVQDPDTYRVDEFRRLVRLDNTVPVSGGGGACWPFCQDLTKEDTEVGTWSVTLQYGRPVPQLARLAAAELACQLINQCVGQPCQLPSRTSSITRQGVTVAFLDPMDFWAEGRTGIYLVDLAIQTFNPHHLTRRPAIWSPDAKNWTVTTSPPGEDCT